MSGPSIAPFGPTEYPRWHELFGAYNAFYGKALGDEVYAATWTRLIDPNGLLFGLAARDDDGRAIGFAHYLFHGSTWSTHDVCYLEDLFVEPAVRGSGVGRTLIVAVADAARARGCERLYWLTQESNGTARRLYDAVGVNLGFIRYDLRL